MQHLVLILKYYFQNWKREKFSLSDFEGLVIVTTSNRQKIVAYESPNHTAKIHNRSYVIKGLPQKEIIESIGNQRIFVYRK